jgi:hypothetical protein
MSKRNHESKGRTTHPPDNGRSFQTGSISTGKALTPESSHKPDADRMRRDHQPKESPPADNPHIVEVSFHAPLDDYHGRKAAKVQISWLDSELNRTPVEDDLVLKRFEDLKQYLRTRSPLCRRLLVDMMLSGSITDPEVRSGILYCMKTLMPLLKDYEFGFASMNLNFEHTETDEAAVGGAILGLLLGLTAAAGWQVDVVKDSDRAWINDPNFTIMTFTWRGAPILPGP